MKERVSHQSEKLAAAKSLLQNCKSLAKIADAGASVYFDTGTSTHIAALKLQNALKKNGLEATGSIITANKDIWRQDKKVAPVRTIGGEYVESYRCNLPVRLIEQCAVGANCDGTECGAQVFDLELSSSACFVMGCTWFSPIAGPATRSDEHAVMKRLAVNSATHGYKRPENVWWLFDYTKWLYLPDRRIGSGAQNFFEKCRLVFYLQPAPLDFKRYLTPRHNHFLSDFHSRFCNDCHEAYDPQASYYDRDAAGDGVDIEGSEIDLGYAEDVLAKSALDVVGLHKHLSWVKFYEGQHMIVGLPDDHDARAKVLDWIRQDIEAVNVALAACGFSNRYACGVHNDYCENQFEEYSQQFFDDRAVVLTIRKKRVHPK